MNNRPPVNVLSLMALLCIPPSGHFLLGRATLGASRLICCRLAFSCQPRRPHPLSRYTPRQKKVRYRDTSDSPSRKPPSPPHPPHQREGSSAQSLSPIASVAVPLVKKMLASKVALRGSTAAIGLRRMPLAQAAVLPRLASRQVWTPPPPPPLVSVFAIASIVLIYHSSPRCGPLHGRKYRSFRGRSFPSPPSASTQTPPPPAQDPAKHTCSPSTFHPSNPLHPSSPPLSTSASSRRSASTTAPAPHRSSSTSSKTSMSSRLAPGGSPSCSPSSLSAPSSSPSTCACPSPRRG